MAKRRSIEIPGLSHGGAPIPMGAKVGNIVFSSGIMGADSSNGAIPKEDPQAQARLIFENVRSFMQQAGGSPDDIVRMTVHLKDRKYREYVDHYWLEMFPDPQDRPARHVLQTDLPGDMLIQVEIVAVL